jgi:hypothetical protein
MEMETQHSQRIAFSFGSLLLLTLVVRIGYLLQPCCSICCVATTSGAQRYQIRETKSSDEPSFKLARMEFVIQILPGGGSSACNAVS